jgi:REP element-mobilizing transposase RayT
MSGRGTRMKVTGEGCYYHLMNRTSGCRGEKPFNQVDMEYGFRLLQNLCEYFLIEVISAAWMDNHFHLVVYAPGPNELPPIEDISKRHNSYYSNMLDKFTYAPKQMPKINPADLEICREIGLKMIDISYFMRAFQQRFTVVYNQSRDRIGKLWANKFKSVILDNRNSLEACVLYVELNPVRAGLTTDPADYHFTTWAATTAPANTFFMQISSNISNKTSGIATPRNGPITIYSAIFAVNWRESSRRKAEPQVKRYLSRRNEPNAKNQCLSVFCDAPVTSATERY